MAVASLSRLTPHLSHRQPTRAAMLATIGVARVEELFAADPRGRAPGARRSSCRTGLTEQEVYAHLRELAARNVSAEDEICFLGAGMYDHYVPAFIDMLISRSEFLTPYTPYQPEISQGGLQVMFEYQTAICELTACPCRTPRCTRGPRALAAAGYLAKLHNGRARFVVSRGVHPHALRDVAHARRRLRHEVVEVPLRDGVTDPQAWARRDRR